MKETTAIGIFLYSIPFHENLFQKTIEGKRKETERKKKTCERKEKVKYRKR